MKHIESQTSLLSNSIVEAFIEEISDSEGKQSKPDLKQQKTQSRFIVVQSAEISKGKRSMDPSECFTFEAVTP